jgi:hypothetical protein
MNFNSIEHPKMTMDKMEIFESIKTPQELLDFMGKNIDYGFVGRNDRKKYIGGFEGKDMDREYFLQNPEEVIKSGVGTCWDTTELERNWFVKHGYECKAIFLFFAKEAFGHLPTHTLLAYKQEDTWVWFEYSFGVHRGIHEYDSFEDLVVDVRKKQFEYAHEFCGATDEDEKYLRDFEFETPRYGCTAQEFIAQTIGKRGVVESF